MNSDLEQRCHVLTQQLEISQLAVKELQSNADQVTSLEGVTEQLSREVKASEQRADQLSQVQCTSASLVCVCVYVCVCGRADQLSQVHRLPQCVCGVSCSPVIHLW